MRQPHEADLFTKRPTRKELVLDYLQERAGEWVPGMELMNQYVGGTRAGARIHELREQGYVIERRSSPNSAVDEYRYVGTRAALENIEQLAWT